MLNLDLAKLEPGYKYLVEETVIPDGYTNVPEKLIISKCIGTISS